MITLAQGIETAKGLGLTIYDHNFGTSSKKNLDGVLPTLVDVAVLAIMICEYDGTVVTNGGVRSQEAANENAENGTGITDSRHLIQSDGYGHAIDCIALTPGSGIDWTNMKAFQAMADAVKTAAAILMVPIRQGCDWNMNGTFAEKNEWDWAHFEDPKQKYMQAAIAEMHRHRRVLGLDEEPIHPPTSGTFECPNCGVKLRLEVA